MLENRGGAGAEKKAIDVVNKCSVTVQQYHVTRQGNPEQERSRLAWADVQCASALVTDIFLACVLVGYM